MKAHLARAALHVGVVLTASLVLGVRPSIASAQQASRQAPK
jgi:hypothetical protein